MMEKNMLIKNVYRYFVLLLLSWCGGDILYEMCKYKQEIGNSEETGMELCTRNTSYFPVNYKDDCHFIPQRRELVCGDCAALGEDFGCMGMEVDSSAYMDGKLCWGFRDLRKQEFANILADSIPKCFRTHLIRMRHTELKQEKSIGVMQQISKRQWVKTVP